MTYARSRLWLGMTGVGTVVTFAFLALVTAWPAKALPTDTSSLTNDALWIGTGALGFLLMMVPFDFLGGYLLPRRFGRQTPPFSIFIRRWLVGVTLQSTWFLCVGSAILWVGRSAGIGGALTVIAIAALAQIVLQGRMLRALVCNVPDDRIEVMSRVRSQLRAWKLPNPRLQVADSSDPGFTGGVIGLPGREEIIVPLHWLDTLDADQIAAVIARRVEAIQSGSRSYGLAFALLWIFAGFIVSTGLPGAGVTSIAELATTCCGFTCWTFLGLLVLPTLSRRACFALDIRVVGHGISANLLSRSLERLDRLQDDEPKRPIIIETIFHPVPSISNRTVTHSVPRVGFWHVARTTLFLSWSCIGLLSRAVHCNAGRPELWIMLPTD